MLYLDRKLRLRQYPNCLQVAKYFEVDRRTIERDIAFMRVRLGAQIEFDNKNGGFVYIGKSPFEL
jgi:predicted DNA-binding transcriptional regulator YafY